jgi:hypothetical protein
VIHCVNLKANIGSNCLTFKGGSFMNIKDALSKRKENEAKFIAKALEDSEFRRELLENPKAALEKESGKSFPDGLSVQILEEDANSITIVLPKLPESVDSASELSDEALEQVAGGVVAAIVVSTVTGVVV